MVLLELDGGAHPERAVQPGRVVEPLDVLEDCRTQLSAGGPAARRGTGPEVPADQVWERLNPGHTNRAAPLAPPVSTLQARQRHQPRHALLTHANPLTGQHRVHARAAVAAAAGSVDPADLCGQPGVAEL